MAKGHKTEIIDSPVPLLSVLAYVCRLASRSCAEACCSKQKSDHLAIFGELRSSLNKF